MVPKKPASRKNPPGSKALPLSESERMALEFQSTLLDAVEWYYPLARAISALGEPMGKLTLSKRQKGLCSLVHDFVKPVNKKKVYSPGDGTVAEGLGLLLGLAFCLEEGLVFIDADVVKATQSLILAITEGIERCQAKMQDARKGQKEDTSPSTRKSQAPGDKEPAASAIGEIFQFKITLIDSKPAIWRRIQVRDCTFTQLHHHIQAAMGWTNSHLHQFHLGGVLIGNPRHLELHPGEFRGLDSSKVTLRQLLAGGKGNWKLRYEYDFGDGWEHQVTLEKRLDPEPGVKYPRCVGGENACPPENCGGVWGFYEMLEAIKDPANERHEELLEWLGGDFDPSEFDPVEATKAMAKKRQNQ